MINLPDLYAADLSGVAWRTSSFTSNNGACVEVADGLPGIVAVRDTKNRDIPAIRVSPQAWASFVRAVDNGNL